MSQDWPKARLNCGAEHVSHCVSKSAEFMLELAWHSISVRWSKQSSAIEAWRRQWHAPPNSASAARLCTSFFRAQPKPNYRSTTKLVRAVRADTITQAFDLAGSGSPIGHTEKIEFFGFVLPNCSFVLRENSPGTAEAWLPAMQPQSILDVSLRRADASKARMANLRRDSARRS